MNELALAAALYFNHELAVDPAPIAALWRRLAKPAKLRQWWATAKASQKPKPLDLDALVANRVGRHRAAAVESEYRGFFAFAQTAPLATLDEGVPPRQWRYDAVEIALGPHELATIGRQEVLDALCDFAGAVGVKAGIVVWSPSLAYASALAMLSSGREIFEGSGEPRRRQLLLAYALGTRGNCADQWGTFLSATHVVALGNLSKLPAAKHSRSRRVARSSRRRTTRSTSTRHHPGARQPARRTRARDACRALTRCSR